MKCPKCGYLGFEDVDRCRNCGYDFSLTAAPTIPDLPIRRGSNTPHPLADLALVDAASAPLPPPMTDVAADVDRALQLREPAATRSSSSAGVELPLFGPPIPDDEPLIRRASPPRAPLAVRRGTPEVPRPREEPRPTALELGLESESEPAPRTRRATTPTPAPIDNVEPPAAGIVSRLIAVVIDLVILATIDVAVVYFTMRICGLAFDDVGVLPKGPLIAFLLVQNGGYLVAFTAGGQTLGKMVAGIRVVASESSEPLDLGRAFLRTFMWVLLAVPAGLGFISAIFSRDRRGLHDRFAGTRVVRASA
jgi:uncharacterized RDD family membrane protein YckC